MDRFEEYAVMALIVLTLGLYADWAFADEHQFWAEVGVGYNTSFFQDTERYQWDNAEQAGFMGKLSYEYYPVDRLAFTVNYTHASQWLAGPPFNSKGESSLDHIGVAVRWRLNK